MQRWYAVGAGVLLMWWGAQVSWQLPIASVPFIMTDWVLFTFALTLGAMRSLTMVLIYLILGGVGLPVFAEGAHGWQHLIGPTAGYLLGYLLAAGITGFIAEHGKHSLQRDALAWIVGVSILFALGVSGLRFVSHLSWQQAIEVGVKPFVWIALAKGITAVLTAQALRKILPKI